MGAKSKLRAVASVAPLDYPAVRVNVPAPSNDNRYCLLAGGLDLFLQLDAPRSPDVLFTVGDTAFSLDEHPCAGLMLAQGIDDAQEDVGFELYNSNVIFVSGEAEAEC